MRDEDHPEVCTSTGYDDKKRAAVEELARIMMLALLDKLGAKGPGRVVQWMVGAAPKKRSPDSWAGISGFIATSCGAG
jgi:hypothetical protein